MQPNSKAIKTLIFLVLAVACLFAMEKQFLVSETRGESISHYQAIPWNDKILLLVDDFEGLGNDSVLAKEKFFSYGSVKISTDDSPPDESPINSKTALKISWKKTDGFGGWGKGVGKNINLDATEDHFTFRVYFPESNGKDEMVKIQFQEDDNNDGFLQEDKDDAWFYLATIAAKNKWQFISIPLKDFKDGNAGGDSLLNVTRKGGLHNLIFSLEQPGKYTTDHRWYFDFICFTKGKIETF